MQFSAIQVVPNKVWGGDLLCLERDVDGVFYASPTWPIRHCVDEKLNNNAQCLASERECIDRFCMYEEKSEDGRYQLNNI